MYRDMAAEKFQEILEESQNPWNINALKEFAIILFLTIRFSAEHLFEEMMGY